MTEPSPWRILLLIGIVVVLLLGTAPLAKAQTTVGGHIGFLVPWVTRAGGENTTVFDSYSLGLPFGITVKGQGRFFVDFEFIPTVHQTPRETTLTVDPGILYRVGRGFTVGLRATFDVNSPRVGFVPLLNKSWKLGTGTNFFKTFFAEIDVPVTFSRPTGGPATNPTTFATQFGFGF
jgi:hypothetical protein